MCTYNKMGILEQPLAEMLSQSSMLGKLRELFYRGYWGRRLFILITQTDAIYVNDEEEQKYLHQNTFSELQTT